MIYLSSLRLVAVAAGASFLFGSAAIAHQHESDILVQGTRVDSRSWTKHVQRELSDNLRVPPILDGSQPPSGYSRVRFVCGDDGRATDISIDGGSHVRMIDRAALRDVAMLHGLSPLPAGMADGRAIEARLFFADSHDALQLEMKRAQREAAPRIASIGGQQPVDLTAIATTGRAGDD